MNHVSLIGRLTKDLELKHTPAGNAVINFTLAVNRNFTNQQGEREADFIQCQAWKKTAELLTQYTRKGTQIGVLGRIQTRNYDNQQGQRVFVTEVIVESFYLLDPKPGNQQAQSSQTQNNYQQQQYQQPAHQYDYNRDAEMIESAERLDISEEDLPF